MAVVPGDAFGHNADGMVRIALSAADADLAEGIDRLVRLLERSQEPSLPGAAAGTS